MTADAKKVYDVVSQIPLGKVLTYKKVAELCGIKSPRQVGKILHSNPDPDHIPCHRVVNSKGQVAEKYAFGGSEGQIEKLRVEGIAFKKDCVDNMNVYLWCH